MCSISGILDTRLEPAELRRTALEMSRRQRHRGPDWSGVWAEEGAVLAHERLSIVDVEGGAQPIVSADGDLVLAVNGEIYNHRAIRARLAGYPFVTGSDCEVISALYREKGADFLNELDGIFAFVLWDRRRRRYLVGRDPIGVVPLYLGRDAHGQLLVASELKALVGIAETVEEMPPGHVLDSEVGTPTRYYRPAWRDYDAVRDGALALDELRSAFEGAVERQMMGDVPYGVLLSGGLDSSLVAALVARHARRRVDDDNRSEAWWPRVHSFAIGLEGSPDVAASRRVAEAIGSVHHAATFTVQEGIDALADVVRHVETCDVTSVRASTPMFLLARRIKAMGIKMVLSGEGSDEIFGGYLYFHKAPNARELHEETVRKLDLLHRYDCQRANKAMAAWGVEARVPFLARDFLDVAMSIDPAHKLCRDGRMEKHVLREAFRGVLPDAILWRQKEQFSDGVGYSWIDSLKALAERTVSDAELAGAPERFPIATPVTKEGYLYRTLFDAQFPGDAFARLLPSGPSVACSTPAAIAWDAAFAKNADPSGRAVAVHRAAVAPEALSAARAASLGSASGDEANDGAPWATASGAHSA